MQQGALCLRCFLLEILPQGGLAAFLKHEGKVKIQLRQEGFLKGAIPQQKTLCIAGPVRACLGHHMSSARRGHGAAPCIWSQLTHQTTSSSHFIPASWQFPLIFQGDSYHYPHPASTRGRLNPEASKNGQKPMSFYIGEAKPKSDSACWSTTDGQARGSRGCLLRRSERKA